MVSTVVAVDLSDIFLSCCISTYRRVGYGFDLLNEVVVAGWFPLATCRSIIVLLNEVVVAGWFMPSSCLTDYFLPETE